MFITDIKKDKKHLSRIFLSNGEEILIDVDLCIEKGILLDILTAERTEVFMYILESFDKELYERKNKD